MRRPPAFLERSFPFAAWAALVGTWFSLLAVGCGGAQPRATPALPPLPGPSLRVVHRRPIASWSGWGTGAVRVSEASDGSLAVAWRDPGVVELAVLEPDGSIRARGRLDALATLGARPSPREDLEVAMAGRRVFVLAGELLYALDESEGRLAIAHVAPGPELRARVVPPPGPGSAGGFRFRRAYWQRLSAMAFEQGRLAIAITREIGDAQGVELCIAHYDRSLRDPRARCLGVHGYHAMLLRDPLRIVFFHGSAARQATVDLRRGSVAIADAADARPDDAVDDLFGGRCARLPRMDGTALLLGDCSSGRPTPPVSTPARRRMRWQQFTVLEDGAVLMDADPAGARLFRIDERATIVSSAAVPIGSWDDALLVAVAGDPMIVVTDESGTRVCDERASCISLSTERVGDVVASGADLAACGERSCVTWTPGSAPIEHAVSRADDDLTVIARCDERWLVARSRDERTELATLDVPDRIVATVPWIHDVIVAAGRSWGFARDGVIDLCAGGELRLAMPPQPGDIVLVGSDGIALLVQQDAESFLHRDGVDSFVGPYWIMHAQLDSRGRVWALRVADELREILILESDPIRALRPDDQETLQLYPMPPPEEDPLQPDR